MPRVDNKGVSIHYRVEGNGPPLVLVHGTTDSSEVWYERGYVAALKPKYRLILIDARGHGQAISRTTLHPISRKSSHPTSSPSSTISE